MTRVVRLAAVTIALSLLLAACGEAAATPASAPNSSLGPTTASTVRGFRRVFDQPHLTDGKPLTLFVGGQFCPFCASMRWPLVKALGRFGTISGLGQMQSQAGTDGFASLSTYDFSHVTYVSDYVTLRAVEVADSSGNQLQQPDGEETGLLNQFDPQGSIPFILVGGSYVAQLPYSPALLQDHNFKQILDDVNAPTPGELGKAINDEADGITAAICKTDGGKPAAVCGQAGIAALMAQLP